MSWIDGFAEGCFRLYAGNVMSAFQPLDFFHFYPLYYDLWLSRIVEVMDKLSVEDKHYQELKDLLPPPSNLRAIIQKLIPTYKGLGHKNTDEIRKVADFIARMLLESCPDDPFAVHSNPLHTQDEVKQIVSSVNWQSGDPQIARNIGRLITAAGSLVHGLYNDIVTDMGWDTYGPYSVEWEGQNYSFLIRDFPNLAPAELWSTQHLPSVKDLKIYALYQGVDWEIAFVGCHTIAKSGQPVQGLKKFSVIADGKTLAPEEIVNLINELSGKAESIYKKIRSLDFEELKKLVMLQECYQLHKLFTAAGIEWRPTPEMTARVENKPLMTGVITMGKLMTDLNEYRELFGINLFAREVLGKA